MSKWFIIDETTAIIHGPCNNRQQLLDTMKPDDPDWRQDAEYVERCTNDSGMKHLADNGFAIIEDPNL